MNTINLVAIISTIRSEANEKIVNAIWDLVGAANSALDDGYGSGLSGHYTSTMECATLAVKYIEDICNVLETEDIQYGMVLDILGSIKLNNFDLPEGVVDGLRGRFDKIRNTKKSVYDDDDPDHEDRRKEWLENYAAEEEIFPF